LVVEADPGLTGFACKSSFVALLSTAAWLALSSARRVGDLSPGRKKGPILQNPF
jgi:hypothetical protein